MKLEIKLVATVTRDGKHAPETAQHVVAVVPGHLLSPILGVLQPIALAQMVVADDAVSQPVRDRLRTILEESLGVVRAQVKSFTGRPEAPDKTKRPEVA